MALSENKSDILEKVVRAGMLVIGAITLPLWILPFLFFMNPGKAQRKDYAEFRETMGWEPIPDENRLKAVWKSLRHGF
jgi:hypothetical protein